MNEAALTRDRILDAAQEVLARYGPAKTTVVDVARALGVSHGSVYRHFESKAELRDAVTARWLARVTEPLAAIVAAKGPAPARLKRWFDTLIAIKRGKAAAEPELFATYHGLASQLREVVTAHIDELSGQIGAIVADGVARGEFVAADPAAAGRALFVATARFHDPVYAGEWGDPAKAALFDDVFALLLRGLTPEKRGRK